MSLKLLEDVAQDSRNDATLFPLIASTHGISFSAASLSVRKDSPVITFQTVVDDRSGQHLKYFFLAAFLFKHVTEAVLLLLLG